jgi:hypothetical protein
MPRKRRTNDLAVAGPASSLGILAILDEGTLAEVLRAAKPAKVLAALASASRQLCTLARSSVPVRLSVKNSEQAQLVLLSHARGRPPFSGCTELYLAVGDSVDCLLAAGVLSKAQNWSSLEWLQLVVELDEQQQPARSMDFCVSALLSPVLALQQLRSLELRLPDLGPCSVGHIGQLVQLTRLDLEVRDTAAAAAAARPRLDLGPWSALTNLKHLTVEWAAAVQPAADPAGPFCLPTSLTTLVLSYEDIQHPDPLACWLTHLPGCAQLEELVVTYGPQQHASTHPLVLVRLFSQHNQRVRKLYMYHEGDVPPMWGAAVAGLPDVTAPADGEWHPGPALAALRGLEVLYGEGITLTIREGAHWQHLAQLTALTKLYWAAFHYAPPLHPGSCLAVLDMQDCQIHLGGRGLGLLLLACSQLEKACVSIATPLVSTRAGPSEPQLQPHPKLRTLWVSDCDSWGSAAAAVVAPPQPAAAVAATGAKAHFAALAPVLSGVLDLRLYSWPAGSSSSSSLAVGTLPDLSPCTALTRLVFSCHEGSPDQVHPEQEQFLAMMRPLGGTLQLLGVQRAPRLNARVVLGMQPLLPRLQHISLSQCGAQMPLLPAGSGVVQQQQALDGVKQLLRPGLVLRVHS